MEVIRISDWGFKHTIIILQQPHNYVIVNSSFPVTIPKKQIVINYASGNLEL